MAIGDENSVEFEESSRLCFYLASSRYADNRSSLYAASPEGARASSSASEVLSKLCIVHYWCSFILCLLFGIEGRTVEAKRDIDVR
jgi:hypothetical protein